MADFAYHTLNQLLKTLQAQGFLFFTLDQYHQLPVNTKAIILRHDVEAHYKHALTFAQIQHELGIKGSFYFRLFQVAGNEQIIKQIAALGHEIGYHYDDLSECQGDYEKAIQRFEKNLNYLRQFGPVTTMTMEGAPRSKYDNRMLWLGRLEEMSEEMGRRGEDEMGRRRDGKKTRWEEDEMGRRGEDVRGRRGEEVNGRRREVELGEFHHPLTPSPTHPLTPSSTHALTPTSDQTRPHYNYHNFGISTEPYFDVNFDDFFYLTDTGRRWDGWKVSVRDKVPQQADWVKQGLVFRSTTDIIRAANERRLPDKIMITFHPQRWTDNPFLWIKELVMQTVKNQVKRVLISRGER